MRDGVRSPCQRPTRPPEPRPTARRPVEDPDPEQLVQRTLFVRRRIYEQAAARAAELDEPVGAVLRNWLEIGAQMAPKEPRGG